MVHLLAPRPASAFGVQPPEPVSVPHVAVGLWLGLCVVLLCPSPPRTPRRSPSEDELLRSYGVAMTAFGLL